MLMGDNMNLSSTPYQFNEAKKIESIASATVDVSICIYYQNVRGLRTKTTDFYIATCECDYDVIALTETSLIPSINDCELFNLNDFMVYRCDRNALNSRNIIGGGVLIAIRSSVMSEAVVVEDTENVEMVIVKCIFSKRITYLCCLYIPSGSCTDVYFQYASAIERVLNNIGGDSDVSIFFLGDFNLPSFDWLPDPDNSNVLLPINVGTGSKAEVVHAVMAGGLSQINHVVNYQGTLLDLIFCNDIDEIEVLKCEAPLIPIDLYHEPIEIYFDAATSKALSPPVRHSFDFKMADFDGLNMQLALYDWNRILDNSDSINSAVGLFYKILHDCFDKFIPVKKIKKNTHPPWYNKQVLKLKNIKSKLHRKFKATKSLYDYQVYSVARKKLVESQRIAYNSFSRTTELNLRNDPSKFWSFVNTKKKTSGFPSVMFRGLTKSSNTEHICELFADFFSQNYTIEDNSHNYVTSNVFEMINIGYMTLTEAEICKHLMAIDINKGDGPDNVSPLFLRNCASTLAVPLCNLFNRSLSNGIFPTRWKTSSITPIFKSGSRSNIENYRGIAILPTIGKFFESLVCNLLTPYLKHVISESQHGFFTGRSTTTNLIEFFSYVVSVVESGGQVDVIYTDFSKAFDRVCHSYLIAKLEQIGIHSSFLNWIASYLCGRNQYISLSGWKSRVFDVSSGVPQGSHLGPLLFILFINDVVNHFKHARCLIYADDLKIYLEVRSTNDAIKLQSDLNSLSEWSKSNGLSLNINKCFVMSFFKIRSPTTYSYKLNGIDLSRLNEIRDLGVLFESNVSFNKHIDCVTAKAYSMLGFMKRICSKFVDPYTLLSIYNAHVRSHLEYASIVWYPNYITHVSKLESIQKQFVRYALRRLQWRDRFVLPPYENRCQLLNIDTLSKRRVIAGASFIFDLLSGRINSHALLGKVNLNAPVRSLRSQPFLNPNFHRTNYGHSEPMTNLSNVFNKFANLYEPNMSRQSFRSSLKNLR